MRSVNPLAYVVTQTVMNNVSVSSVALTGVVVSVVSAQSVNFVARPANAFRMASASLNARAWSVVLTVAVVSVVSAWRVLAAPRTVPAVRLNV